MKVYVAGPYSQGDVAVNVNNAIAVADRLLDMGHSPYVPHLTHFWHIISPHERKVWLEMDREWLMACDCVLRLPGKSEGADAETEFAILLGKRVYYNTWEIS